jgi:hypothetical protein
LAEVTGLLLRRHYAHKDDKEPLQETLTRLALLIQNMHILMVHTYAQKFEDCTHQLFKRYITACRVTGSAEKARSAWNALLRTSNSLLLQDVDMCMSYIATLLTHSHNVDDGASEEFLDDAITCAASTCHHSCIAMASNQHVFT